jgi:hypothetical protein
VRTFTRFAVASLVLLLGSSGLFAQAYLPAQFAGWSASETRAFEGSIAQLSGLPPGTQAALQEYGLNGAQQSTYTRSGQSLAVTLYDLRDPSAAYGAYSYLRTAKMQPAGITQHSSSSPSRILILQGSALLDVAGADLSSISGDLKVLASTIAPATPSDDYPLLWERLPRDGFVVGSDHYVLGPVALQTFLPLADGDWAGFASGGEAEIAHYHRNGEDLDLLLVDYPTPQIAMTHLQALGTQFNVNDAVPNDIRPTIYVRRVLTTIAIVYGSRTAATAQGLLKEIGSDADLTWNEPSYSATDPTMPQVVLTIFYGIGILFLFTLGCALLFSGFRLLMKRLFPGRFFDRPSSTEILQLGLSSKPIDHKDFYFGR